LLLGLGLWLLLLPLWDWEREEGAVVAAAVVVEDDEAEERWKLRCFLQATEGAKVGEEGGEEGPQAEQQGSLVASLHDSLAPSSRAQASRRAARARKVAGELGRSLFGASASRLSGLMSALSVDGPEPEPEARLGRGLWGGMAVLDVDAPSAGDSEDLLRDETGLNVETSLQRPSGGVCRVRSSPSSSVSSSRSCC